MKKEKTWNFGRFEAICQFMPHLEQVKIKLNGKTLATGNYTRINRTRQRYDYEMALYDAYENLRKKLTRAELEYYGKECKLIEGRLQDMHGYNWNNRK